MVNAGGKARFSVHCRRGMLELDIILNNFLQNHFDHLSPQETKAFDALLSSTDPELFSWLMGHTEPFDNELKEIVDTIRDKY